MVVDAKLRLLNVFPKLKNILRSNLLPDDNLPDYKSCDVDQRIFHQTTKPSGKIAVVTHNSRNVGEWRWVLFNSFSRGHLYRRQGHSVILGCHIACLTRAGAMDRVETEQRDEPQTDFIYCHRAVTEVLKFGSCNPGVVGFYKTFMRTLHRKLGYHHPVWAVSHAGHYASSAAEYDVFGLDGQIEHKLAFLRRHVPRDTRLVLLGHSIGCYIILDMMKRNPELNILKSIMLFPTIERMAQTPQGKVMTPVLCGLRYVAYLPLFLLSLLPEALKAGLIRLALGGICSLDHTVVQPTVGLLSGDCAANAMYMGGQEMKKVLERDDLTIKKNLEKRPTTGALFSIIMTSSRTFHGDFRLCENGFRHAFVLDAGREVAQMVSEWIIFCGGEGVSGNLCPGPSTCLTVTFSLELWIYLVHNTQSSSDSTPPRVLSCEEKAKRQPSISKAVCPWGPGMIRGTAW
ncbi:hypothetical protein F7725_007462 [Dissostichus mawsoni]|uniref:Lipid droplet-associated hydrolase n=1 Tax=Dissostichus mawsoni TaxID=36200 RepID=A0A7J5Y6H3_DISMA|nr:hypothetical protein F7725_007462 [Dissostichus mawsoni]